MKSYRYIAIDIYYLRDSTYSKSNNNSRIQEVIITLSTKNYSYKIIVLLFVSTLLRHTVMLFSKLSSYIHAIDFFLAIVDVGIGDE